MEEELDYAEMLEIPVSTVNVVKKKRFFSRKPAEEDLKEQVVESVNERMGAYVAAEDLTEPEKPAAKKFAINFRKDKASAVLLAEAALVGALALGIFLTNVFLPDTVINGFITSFSKEDAPAEPTYSEFTLASPVGAFSDTEPVLGADGVLRFTAEGSVYPLCGGSVESVAVEQSGAYTLKIAHTSSFSSVVTGLTDAYAASGTAVASGVPIGYSDGGTEITVSMYDGDQLLNCYTLSGSVPVWTT